VNYLLEQPISDIATATGGRILMPRSSASPTKGKVPCWDGTGVTTISLAVGSYAGKVQFAGYGITPYIPVASNRFIYSEDASIDLFGERFNVEHDGKTVIVKHPQWSLVGIGRNQGEATAALLTEAQEVAPFYVLEPDKSLSPDGIELKRFLQKNFK
jgi:hypothetical protein